MEDPDSKLRVGDRALTAAFTVALTVVVAAPIVASCIRPVR